ncbi:MAG: hypothetical protein EWV61_06010 [Microcystis aeruginosa Ma_AC_P_19900807_S300]|nr:MAG: hypothetical protein EWV61_06010 [Microcystis aeruginosa Ma_AC_P_19900807_S300]
MKKFSPPQMKEVSLHPTPHTLHPLSSQEDYFYLFSPLPNSHSAITTGSQKYVGCVSYFVLFVKKTFFLQ